MPTFVKINTKIETAAAARRDMEKEIKIEKIHSRTKRWWGRTWKAVWSFLIYTLASSSEFAIWLIIFIRIVELNVNHAGERLIHELSIEAKIVGRSLMLMSICDNSRIFAVVVWCGGGLIRQWSLKIGHSSLRNPRRICF